MALPFPCPCSAPSLASLYPLNHSLANEMARLFISTEPAAAPTGYQDVDSVMEEFRRNGRESEYFPEDEGPVVQPWSPLKAQPRPPKKVRVPTCGPAPKRRSAHKFKECAFCKNNGEHFTWYQNHYLRDKTGHLQCPILRAYTCPICGAIGDDAHTINYCPENPKAGQEPKHFTKSVTRQVVWLQRFFMDVVSQRQQQRLRRH